mmetsp:Transcript_48617/g.141667  ORF Transcript_48617/g.141667 Transcript_48617/m.141667 type:complete len:273 (-) Transcript_48617:189-1007(-)
MSLPRNTTHMSSSASSSLPTKSEPFKPGGRNAQAETRRFDFSRCKVSSTAVSSNAFSLPTETSPFESPGPSSNKSVGSKRTASLATPASRRTSSSPLPASGPPRGRAFAASGPFEASAIPLSSRLPCTDSVVDLLAAARGQACTAAGASGATACSTKRLAKAAQSQNGDRGLPEGGRRTCGPPPSGRAWLGPATARKTSDNGVGGMQVCRSSSPEAVDSSSSSARGQLWHLARIFGRRCCRATRSAPWYAGFVPGRCRTRWWCFSKASRGTS